MAKLSYLFIPLFLLLISCKDEKKVTTVSKDNVVEQTAKRQVPELTPPPEKPEPKLSSAEIAKNREIFDYHIVAASYNYQKQADAFKDRLYQKGYPSIVLENNGKFRVVLQSFNNKESAIKELKRLRTLNKKPDLWLLRQ
ncbi:SPOR domain-containing protein [Marinifilum fragile]|jgi:Sporulation related domain.|uniref:SPOR domain-containing protein n=1 Tax=Marinifilum fragile TaxID=570161 RepID=UPI002AA9089D|nr:SPOR domain-containing protein [Marinifilum fragile]